MKLDRTPWARQRDALLAVWMGLTIREASVVSGMGQRTINTLLGQHGRVMLCERTRRKNALTLDDRLEIYVGIDRGQTDAAIARRIGFHRGTVGREIKAGGGRGCYKPGLAQDRCDRAASRFRPCWWQTRPCLWAEVLKLLRLKWSPEQISGWLREEYRDDPHWWVSHESIYQAIYLQTGVELRKELKACMRAGHIRRRPRSRRAAQRGSGGIKNKTMISERPVTVEDRAIPGHWEGDLIIGMNSGSAVMTVVERTTGFGCLIKIDTKAAIHVAQRLANHMVTLPEQLCLSLTWDQGIELAAHTKFTVDTGIDVYFCDPHSPWQRGTNENWNGLVRQYLPKGSNLSIHSQADLDKIAAELNDRPRKRYGYKKPADLFNQLVATTP